MTTNAVKRRRRRDAARAARGSRNVPVVQPNSHIGICTRCDRVGLVGDEGICTGFKFTGKLPMPYEQRSKRCDEIWEFHKAGWAARPSV